MALGRIFLVLTAVAMVVVTMVVSSTFRSVDTADVDASYVRAVRDGTLPRRRLQVENTNAESDGTAAADPLPETGDTIENQANEKPKDPDGTNPDDEPDDKQNPANPNSDGDDGDDDDDDDDNEKNVDKGGDNDPSTEAEVKDPGDSIQNVPSTPLSEDDPCKVAKTCQECETKAAELFDESSESTCAYVTGLDDLIHCQTVKKSTITDREGDQCSKTTKETNKQTASSQSSNNQSLVFPDEEESNLGAIFGLVFLLVCGCAAFKFKDKVIGQMNATMGAGGGPVSKTAKYHEVALQEENDEEWGWGEDEGGITGDVEMSSSFKDDNSIHKRRTSSNDALPTTTAKASPMFPKKSPLISGQAKSHVPIEHPIPKLPKAIPQAPLSGSGMAPISKPGLAFSTQALTPSKAGLSLSTPTPPAFVAAPPASAPIAAAEFNQFQGMQITSLGPKRSASATPVKKPAVPAPSPEEDIFASMGLLANPTFSHAPAPAPKLGVTTSSTRWNAPIASQPANMTSNAVASFGAEDGDDNWDDDGDLDDLLDE